MLTKESSQGFNPANSYPTYQYKSKNGRRGKAKCDGSRIVPKPKGYIETIECHDEDEHFRDYVRWNTEDHKDIPDGRFKEAPLGIFIGRWRNARWYDEAQRRGLV